jgi:hypothetical protein
VKYTSFAVKLDALRNTKNLAELRIQVGDDFPLETRRIRKNLVPYLKDAKKYGLRAFLKKKKTSWQWKGN